MRNEVGPQDEDGPRFFCPISPLSPIFLEKKSCFFSKFSLNYASILGKRHA